MHKPPFSLARIALAVSIVSTLLMPLSSLASGSELCLEVFGGVPTFKRVNSTARMDANSYPMPNARQKNEYEISLFPKDIRFRDLLRRGDVVLDVGGGQGRAMSELAQALPVHTIVINTQDFSALHSRTRFKGSLEYKVGWAEQKLKEIPSGSVHLVVDLWGAFTYSPNKAEILEEIYRILKPGGRAYLLFPNKTPAHVEDPSINYGQPMQLDAYFMRKFPGLVSRRNSQHSELQSTKVIEIAKPASGEPRTIDANIEVVDVIRNADGRRANSAFSSVTYGVKDSSRN
ncbi:MAG: class I SAM-dependent methyltransferase [Bdellovibrionota bacterium]